MNGLPAFKEKAMNTTIRVTDRSSAQKNVFTGAGNLSVLLARPSVIEIQGKSQDVERYIREGDDLLIYMADGSVIRCNGYFIMDEETGHHSELVFNDEQALTHISFAEADGVIATELQPQAASIATIEPLLESSVVESETPWGWMAGAALGGIAAGAIVEHSRGDSGVRTEIQTPDVAQEVASVKPIFMVTDDLQGKQVVVSNGDRTSDNTPVFSGIGQPGATIQIKDSKGDTVASTMVGSDGKWSVALPTQADGTHSWSVLQIDGSQSVSGGEITLTISTQQAEIAFAVTAGDNTLNASEQAAGFTLSGTTQHLAEGTTLTVMLNGKEYTTVVNGDGQWSVTLPGSDALALADGTWTVSVTGKDAAGNSLSASQTLNVDTQAPTFTLDPVTDDNVINIAERGEPVTLSGSTTAEAGQKLTLTFNDQSYITTIGEDGRWSVELPAGAFAGLQDGACTLQLSAEDKAGNSGSASHQITLSSEAPTITVDNFAGDNILNAEEFGTAQTVSGTTTGAEGQTVLLTLNGKSYTAVVQDDGSWRCKLASDDFATLSDGSAYVIHAEVSNAIGNSASAERAFTVDISAPLSGITIDAITEDMGLSGSDFITQDTSITLSGSLTRALASGDRVQVSYDNGKSWLDATVADKQWSYADSRELADGDYNWLVRVIDGAGNVGATARQTVTIDTQAPLAEGKIVSYNDDAGERQGYFNEALASDDTTPVINGTLSQALAEGEIAQLYRDGVLLGAVTMNDNTHWSYSDSGLTDGDHTYQLRVTDKAGNTTESADFVLKIDTTIPTTSATVTEQTVADDTPVITGTLSAALANGEFLSVTVNGKTYTSESGGAIVVDADSNSWSLQIPDSDRLDVDSYNVTAQVKSSAGNGNTTGIASGTLVITPVELDTDWANISGNSNNETMTFGINSSGLWDIVANNVAYSSSDAAVYTASKLSNTRNNPLVSQTLADYDRSGTADVFGTENTYGGSTQIMWKNTGTGYSGSQLGMGTTIYYGGVIAYDKTGDGWLDLAYGDAGMDSLTYLANNNGVLSPDGSGGEGGFSGQFNSGREISGVDLNNDGTVDIVQHTDNSGRYALTSIINNGDGTLSVGQNISDVFVANASNTNTAASMTWADFNGDGYMDLYLGSSYGNNGGVIYYNDGTGKLSESKSQVEASNATSGYLSVAVDWNHDGQMDIVKFSTYGGSQTATLFTNTDNGASWSATQLASDLSNITGIAAIDYNWDGAKDLMVSQQNGKIVYIQNNEAIADKSVIHLRILDSEGLNVYYGNTVNLYDAAGSLVASQIINAQSGVGVNDTSALVSFYGLDAQETYRAEIVKITNGVSDNVSWDGLVAGSGKEGYVVTAEASTGVHGGTLTGTGYNDTFTAEEGSWIYNGSGGWSSASGRDSWDSSGGMDIVDYHNATAGVTVNLGVSTAQDTGYNSATFINVEGIKGSDFDDVLTGSSGDNQFEGRGGNDVFNIGSGGHDTLLYRLISAGDATGGNGSDVVNGFTVGAWEGTADTDRIDLRELLSDSGYTGTASASYVDGVATLDSSAGDISNYIRVVQNGSNTEIQIDRDGTGTSFEPATILTLNGVQTDLATLLANHQLLVV